MSGNTAIALVFLIVAFVMWLIDVCREASKRADMIIRSAEKENDATPECASAPAVSGEKKS